MNQPCIMWWKRIVLTNQTLWITFAAHTHTHLMGDSEAVRRIPFTRKGNLKRGVPSRCFPRWLLVRAIRAGSPVTPKRGPIETGGHTHASGFPIFGGCFFEDPLGMAQKRTPKENPPISVKVFFELLVASSKPTSNYWDRMFPPPQEISPGIPNSKPPE